MKEGACGDTVLVLGKGGFGIQLAQWLQSAGAAGKVLFLDDAAAGCAGRLCDLDSPALRAQCTAAYVGLGGNALRVEWLQRLAAAGYDTPAFLHPAAFVSPTAALGPGCLVGPLAYVGAGVRAGKGCLLNAGSITDHDARLGDGVHVAPGGIVKAGAVVAQLVKVESGRVAEREG